MLNAEQVRAYQAPPGLLRGHVVAVAGAGALLEVTGPGEAAAPRRVSAFAAAISCRMPTEARNDTPERRRPIPACSRTAS